MPPSPSTIGWSSCATWAGGHTTNDIVVVVPDAGVLFAGDLIEESSPPYFQDSYPLEWPDTVVALLEMAQGPVVPGHGAVVDRAFVAAQHQDPAEVPRREGFVDAGGCPIHYLDWGDTGAPGLVLIHGGAAHAHWWSFLAPLFPYPWRGAAPGLSGHGGSGRRHAP